MEVVEKYPVVVPWIKQYYDKDAQEFVEMTLYILKWKDSKGEHFTVEFSDGTPFCSCKLSRSQVGSSKDIFTEKGPCPSCDIKCKKGHIEQFGFQAFEWYLKEYSSKKGTSEELPPCMFCNMERITDLSLDKQKMAIEKYRPAQPVSVYKSKINDDNYKKKRDTKVNNVSKKFDKMKV